MPKQPQLLQKKPHYALELKKSIVRDFETGRYSALQLSRLHGISLQSIYNWIHKLSHHNQRGTRIVEYADSSQQ
ncbi:MAG: transposase, partial [Bacteroidota bacterium]